MSTYIEQTQSQLQAAKERVSKVAIGTTGTLLAVKVVAAVFTGSIGLAADAVHSLIDLTGAIIGFLGVRLAGKPPDERHSFGHGRAEDIAGATIATLIFIAAGIIAYKAIQRLLEGAMVQMLEAGIIATAIAIAINISVARYVLTTAKTADSVALEATGRDLMADVMSSVAVLVGLVLVRATGQPLLDPAVALIVVVLIVRTASGTMRKAVNNLMDIRLPEHEENAIRAAIEGREDIANYHALRTRKAGNQRHVVVHIVVPRDKTVEQGHQIAEDTENDIRALFPGAAVTIHVEPCTPDCAECPAQCDAPPGRSDPR
jgi:cation diffusion facilitator family transporter